MATEVRSHFSRASPGVRIAVTAPHPDDFDAIAVTLRGFHADGHLLELAVLTRGQSGVDNGYAGKRTVEEKARLREAEQRASCAEFGLESSRLSFLRLAEDDRGHPLLNDENAAAVRAFLKRARPDIIFLPHGRDANVAHQRTHALVTGIVAQDRLSVQLCLNEDPKTIAMRHDLVTGFGEADAEWKSRLLRLHASQHDRNLRSRGVGFDERVLAMNRKCAEALELSEPYAEAFELARYADGALRQAQRSGTYRTRNR